MQTYVSSTGREHEPLNRQSSALGWAQTSPEQTHSQPTADGRGGLSGVRNDSKSGHEASRAADAGASTAAGGVSTAAGGASTAAGGAATVATAALAPRRARWKSSPAASALKREAGLMATHPCTPAATSAWGEPGVGSSRALGFSQIKAPQHKEA